MIIDLRRGFGDFEEYKLFKFPDNSIKFELKIETYLEYKQDILIITTLKSNEDLITLGLIADYFEGHEVMVSIKYMMYQQDDRRFSTLESFGLRFVARYLNSFKNITQIDIFHPHSDKVELINKVNIISNMDFVQRSIRDINNKNAMWVIPDAGAFKTQFKQVMTTKRDFITCMKSRDHKTGELTTIVNSDDLNGRDCFIVDDICIGGRTFMNIAQELKKKNAGKLYLIVSHGIFNYGTDQLFEHFEKIYTTNSICELDKSDRLIKYNV